MASSFSSLGLRTWAADVEDVAAVALQAGLLLIEALHGLLGNRHDLRGLKGGGGGKAHVGGHCHAVHLLIFGDPGVLVVAAGGVVVDVAQQDAGLLALLGEGQQLCRALAQLARKAGQLCGEGLQLFQVFLPGLVAGIEVFDGPAVGLGELAAFRNLFRFSHVVLSFLKQHI